MRARTAGFQDSVARERRLTCQANHWARCGAARLSRGPPAEKSLAQKNQFRLHFQSDHDRKIGKPKYSTFVFPEIVLPCRSSRLDTRGVSRSSRHARRRCGGRIELQRDLITPTNNAIRTVKSCGPGIPVLMPRAMRTHCRGRDDAKHRRGYGGKKAGPRGEHEAAVKTIAQGRPGLGLKGSSQHWFVLFSPMTATRQAPRLAFSSQGLSRSAVESLGHRGYLIGAIDAQVFAFREVLPQQSVGVLVRAALPRAVRVAEVNLDARIDLETLVLSHFGSRSQVSERRNSSGRVMMVRAIASRTASAPCPESAGPPLARGPSPCPANRGRCSSIVKRVVRSTSVPIAELSPPIIRSPSQCPGTARSATSAGRSLIMISGVTKLLPRLPVRALGTRRARPLRKQLVSSRRRAPRP